MASTSKATNKTPPVKTPRAAAAPQGASLVDSRAAADEADAHAGDPDFMASLGRGLAVLLAFSQLQRALTIAQISHRTGLSRAAVRRCLYTLSVLGYVRSDDGRHHQLGSKVLAFGHAYLSSSSLAMQAPAVLDRLSEQVAESCSAATLEGQEITYVARSKSTSRIMSVDLGVGSRLPAYCTSMGRVLMAAMSPQELDEHMAGQRYARRTPHTVTALRQLRLVLAGVREAGYAINDQELELGLRSIAVPVRNRRGVVVAALNVGTQAARRSVQEMETRLLPPLRKAAADLEALLWN